MQILNNQYGGQDKLLMLFLYIQARATAYVPTVHHSCTQAHQVQCIFMLRNRARTTAYMPTVHEYS